MTRLVGPLQVPFDVPDDPIPDGWEVSPIAGGRGEEEVERVEGESGAIEEEAEEGTGGRTDKGDQEGRMPFHLRQAQTPSYASGRGRTRGEGVVRRHGVSSGWRRETGRRRVGQGT